MLSRTSRIKLQVFLLVTVATLAIVGVSYMRVPQQVGLGVYHVDLHLEHASGLYPSAAVSYRGYDVGTVSEISVDDQGVVAVLRISSDYDIPADVVAEVHSASAIGEQYVDLIPRSGDGPTLADGGDVPVTSVRTPVSTSALLAHVNELVQSVPQQGLRTTVDELYDGVNGSSDDLRRLLDSAMVFQQSAEDNLQPTLALIRDSLPVLATQQRARQQIRSYSHDLAGFSQTLAADDAHLRTLLPRTLGLTTQVNRLYDELNPTLPVLLADLATSGRVVQVYLPNLEHVLIVFPALVAVVQSLVPRSRFDDPLIGASLDFKAAVNNPPVCTTGFADTSHQRDPRDFTKVAPPTNSYCKVAANDPRIVRGARNLPCPEGGRGPSAAACGLVFGRVQVPGYTNSRTASYDPRSGRIVTPDGKTYDLAALASHASPAQTWQQLLLDVIRP